MKELGHCEGVKKIRPTTWKSKPYILYVLIESSENNGGKQAAGTMLKRNSIPIDFTGSRMICFVQSQERIEADFIWVDCFTCRGHPFSQRG